MTLDWWAATLDWWTGSGTGPGLAGRQRRPAARRQWSAEGPSRARGGRAPVRGGRPVDRAASLPSHAAEAPDSRPSGRRETGQLHSDMAEPHRFNELVPFKGTFGNGVIAMATLRYKDTEMCHHTQTALQVS